VCMNFYALGTNFIASLEYVEVSLAQWQGSFEFCSLRDLSVNECGLWRDVEST